MKFIDEIYLTVKAGDGGNGVVSFRHDYRNPKAGPDGGNGGSGGHVYFQGDEQTNSFFSLSSKKLWAAGSGTNGQNQLKTGKSGESTYIKVPLGTIIKLNEEKPAFAQNYKEIILGEILFPQQTLLIAKGGKGGLGNAAFASSVNRAPHYAQKGRLGEKFQLKLELKILADVGLLGLPNVGKSTLINALTNTKVKTANFPFTTLNPQLGVLTKGEQKITIADLPGIMEGAAQGKGLGLQFLRHIVRCSLIIYVLDASRDNPWQDLSVLEKELKDSGFIEPQNKQKIIIWNKIDLLSLAKKKELQKKSQLELSNEKHLFISATQRINLDLLTQELFESIKKSQETNIISLSPLHKIYDFTVLVDWQIVSLKPHYWKLTGSFIENLSQKYPQPEKLIQHLKKTNLSEYLQQKGVKSNDVIVISNQEFFWQYEEHN
ncbi:Obg family GTPase CgtA [endosymbiont GvMRE of Glomus versiforme]|uniref:Obg family GTPase CgtA n=1 Tax=endosymbiont GvMRE of Glomus versiforme TaxID=2039283 RepID=UPI000EE6F6FC|nr:GTPase ObgE [endosymbiont GvMRE of Glomus versiforme]RHZ37294.1 GTPase Obg [endosymbiont GvMRE of Glomus versiforme]